MSKILQVNATSGGVDAYIEKTVSYSEPFYFQFDVYWPSASASAWVTDGYFPWFVGFRQDPDSFTGGVGNIYIDFTSYPTYSWFGDSPTTHVESDTWHTIQAKIYDTSTILADGDVSIDGDPAETNQFNLNPQNFQYTSGSNTIFGDSTAQKIAASFTSVGGLARKVLAYNLVKHNSPTDNVTCDICADSSGHPGTSLAQVSLPASTLPSHPVFDFTSAALTLSPGTTYWIVFGRSGSTDATNNYKAYKDSGASNGASYNGSSWTTGISSPEFQLFYDNDYIVRIGNFFVDAVDAITYFRNFKAGTTPGASDIWDGTAFTSLSDFDTYSGDATVIDDPFASPPPPDPLPSQEYVYQWVIKHYNHTGTTEVPADYTGYSYATTSAEVFHAFNRNMTFYLNGLDDCGFSLYLDDPMAALIVPTKSVIRVWRHVYESDGTTLIYEDADETPAFTGTVVNTIKDGDANTMSIKCYSPLWKLQTRFHVNNHYLVTDPDTSSEYTGTGLIFHLINLLHQYDGTHYTGIEPGTRHWGGEPIVAPYFIERGTFTWAIVFDDILSRPASADLIPIYNNDGTHTQMFLDTAQKRGSDKSAIIFFNYHTGTNDNCENMTEELVVNPGEFANYVWAIGMGGPNSGRVALSLDDSSGDYDLNTVGRYMAITDESQLKRLSALQPIADDFLAQSRWPKDAHAVTLSPYGDLIYKYHYDVGDVIQAVADKGALQVNKKQRIYQIGLTMSENNVEQASPLIAKDFTGKVEGT